MTTARKLFKRRSNRVRISIKKNNIKNRIRLSVFRSNQHIYAQLIDDCKGITIASASTLNVTEVKKGNNKEAAQYVGQLIAKAAQKNSIKEVVFDKGGYIFHGRVKALADAAREQGLLF